MKAHSIKFKGHRCFKSQYAGFDEVKPINVVIGRNNSGKSHLLDLVSTLCAGKLDGGGWEYQCFGTLGQEDLEPVFRPGTTGGELRGSHWDDHGRLFVNKEVMWEIDQHGNVGSVNFDVSVDLNSQFGAQSTSARLEHFRRLLRQPQHCLNGKHFRRILADRDIRPEPVNNTLGLESDGSGATNIIRRYITTSNPRYPCEIVQKELLDALNKIFGNDGQFTEIQVKVHDDTNASSLNGKWEVFLGEAKKGLVSLSNSGSGLKTIILALLNLLVIPAIEGKSRAEYTFAFEELENNLHPAMLRRLLQFIEAYAVREKTPVFLTTHSSTALDLFGVSPQSQILHVTHDREMARVTKVSAHFDHLGVISELGAKPSDLLQANGIIWVEGPSDCIYVNRWLDLYTSGRLQEGRDYQCAFYGGSLLARTQFKPPEEAEAELINLFRVNSNVVVMCDGDRSRKNARIKDRVRRITVEVRKIPGAHVWITGAREIENYVPGAVLSKALDFTATLEDPTQYEPFFPRKGSPGASYLETKMNRKGIDKMDLAVLCVPHMELETMRTRFDWDNQMRQLVERITAWNK